MNNEKKCSKSEFIGFSLRFFNEDKKVKREIETIKPIELSLNSYIIKILKEHINKETKRRAERSLKEIEFKINGDLDLPIILRLRNIKIISTKLGIYMEKIEKNYRSVFIRFITRIFIGQKGNVFTKRKDCKKDKNSTAKSYIHIIDNKKGIMIISQINKPTKEIIRLWGNIDKNEYMQEHILKGGDLSYRNYMISKSVKA